MENKNCNQYRTQQENCICVFNNNYLLQVCSASNCEAHHVKDLNLLAWFDSDWLSANLRTLVNNISLPFETSEVYTSDSKLN